MARTDEPAAEPVKTSWGWVIGVLLIPVLLLFAWAAFKALTVVGTPEAQARAAARDAIDACRAGVDDALQELAVRRATRARCERLEAEFRRQWGREP